MVRVISAQTPAAAPHAPESLLPPKDEQLLFLLTGKGKQIYVCQKTRDVYAWKLKAPDAQLLTENGSSAGRHFAGPTWESTDGSRVVGQMVAAVAAPDAGSIPWLLLRKRSSEGAGSMARVQSIQRLNTKGGVAPKNGCASGTENDETSVPYEAVYYFFGVATNSGAGNHNQ